MHNLIIRQTITKDKSDLEKSFKRHNTHESVSMIYTYGQKGPWRLIFSEVYSIRNESIKM
jgi:hypothetical protein